MSRINRYVLREILGPTLLGLLIFGVVLVMNLLLDAAELFIRRDLPLGLVGQYLVLSLPRILVLVIPMSVLLGILVGVGRMAADGEITALRGAGRSDWSLLPPILLLGALGTAAAGLLFNSAVPASNYEQHRMNARIFLSSDLNREIQARVFYERIPNMLIYADTVTPEDGTLRRVLICQKSPSGVEEISTASFASIQQKGMEGTIQFRMDEVVSHAWSPDRPEIYQVSRSRSQTIDRPPDLVVQEMIRSLTAPPPRNLREQSVSQLRATLRELRRFPESEARRHETAETLVELHKKFSLPATSLAFALLALPLALGRRRTSSRASGFVVSLVVIVLSYGFLTGGEQLADRGLVNPWLAMWAGNLVFLIAGVAMLATGAFPDLRLRRRRPSATPPGREDTGPPEPGQAPPPEEPIAPVEGAGSPAPRRSRAFLILDRYLLRHLLMVTGFIVATLTVLFSLFYAVDLIDDVLQGRKSLRPLLEYLLYLQPQIVFAYVLPISLCIGTLVTFALLARTHELTAIRSGGIPLARVATPFLFAGVALALLSFVAHDSILPYTNQRANQIRDQIRNRSPRSYRQPERRWVFGTNGGLLNFSDFNRNRNEFQDLNLFQFHPGSHEVSRRLFAERALWKRDSWELQDGWSRSFESGVETFERFASLRFDAIDPPDYFVQDWKAPDQMTLGELKSHVRELEQRGYDTRDLRVGLHRKTAIPAVCLVMVLLALPFALRVERRGAVYALVLSILLAFVYFMTLQGFGKLGEIATLPPVMAAWGPNALFGAVGVWLTATARW